MTTSPRRTRRSLAAPSEEAAAGNETEPVTDEDLEMLLQTRARLTRDEFELLYGASELGREILAREPELKPTTAPPLAVPSALAHTSGSSGHSTDGWISPDDSTGAPGSSQGRDTVRVANGKEDTTSPELTWASPTRTHKLPLGRSTDGSSVKGEPATLRRAPVYISSLSFGDPSVGSGPPRLHLPSYPPPPPHGSLPHLTSSSFASTSNSPIKRKRPTTSYTTTTTKKVQQSNARASPTDDDDASDEYVAKPKQRQRQPGGGGPASTSTHPATGGAPARATATEWTVFCHFTDPDTEVECGAGFVRTYDLKRHEDTVHLGAPSGAALGGAMHACPDCDRTFSRKDAMLRHRKTIDHSIPVEERRGKQGGGGSLKKKAVSA